MYDKRAKTCNRLKAREKSSKINWSSIVQDMYFDLTGDNTLHKVYQTNLIENQNKHRFFFDNDCGRDLKY